MTVKMIEMCARSARTRAKNSLKLLTEREREIPAIAVTRRKQQIDRTDLENQLRHGKTACAPHLEQAQSIFTGKGAPSCLPRNREPVAVTTCRRVLMKPISTK